MTVFVRQAAVWAAGKGLGGTSNLNYMQYLRGSRHDYDDWANQGATGWSYKDVLPYFIQSEDNQNGNYIRTGARDRCGGASLRAVRHVTMRHSHPQSPLAQ